MPPYIGHDDIDILRYPATDESPFTGSGTRRNARSARESPASPRHFMRVVLSHLLDASTSECVACIILLFL
jgi:hypothetical protein